MAQALQGRRGRNFVLRMTEEEEGACLERMAQTGGPLSLGPWLIWRALDGKPPGRRVQLSLAGVTSAGGGNAGAARAMPELGLQQRRVLDLCGGTGSWSAPYRAAGYPVEVVTLPDHDVRTYVPDLSQPVWGVLAAPPCEQFSRAYPRPLKYRDVVGGMACVNACLRIIQQVRPKWWALENPVGYLSRFLGTPRDTWEPTDFGDPWTKATQIWGEYQIPKRGPFVQAQWGGGPPCDVHGNRATRKSGCCSRRECRAKTPPGFARAFFEANP